MKEPAAKARVAAKSHFAPSRFRGVVGLQSIQRDDATTATTRRAAAIHEGCIE